MSFIITGGTGSRAHEPLQAVKYLGEYVRMHDTGDGHLRHLLLSSLASLHRSRTACRRHRRRRGCSCRRRWWGRCCCCVRFRRLLATPKEEAAGRYLQYKARFTRKGVENRKQAAFPQQRKNTQTGDPARTHIHLVANTELAIYVTLKRKTPQPLLCCTLYDSDVVRRAAGGQARTKCRRMWRCYGALRVRHIYYCCKERQLVPSCCHEAPAHHIRWFLVAHVGLAQRGGKRVRCEPVPCHPSSYIPGSCKVASSSPHRFAHGTIGYAGTVSIYSSPLALRYYSVANCTATTSCYPAHNVAISRQRPDYASCNRVGTLQHHPQERWRGLFTMCWCVYSMYCWTYSTLQLIARPTAETDHKDGLRTGYHTTHTQSHPQACPKNDLLPQALDDSRTTVGQVSPVLHQDKTAQHSGTRKH